MTRNYGKHVQLVCYVIFGYNAIYRNIWQIIHIENMINLHCLTLTTKKRKHCFQEAVAFKFEELM